MQVDARQLPPPQLVYKDMQSRPYPMRIPTGAWNLKDIKFHAAAELGPFAVSSFDNPQRDAGGPVDSEISVEVRPRHCGFVPSNQLQSTFVLPCGPDSLLMSCFWPMPQLNLSHGTCIFSGMAF